MFPPQWPGDANDFAQVVLDREGIPLRAFADDDGVWRYPISVEHVSPYYLQALLGYEDRWFYYHPGFNPVALVRAAYQNLSNQRIVSGGSTLTMQVARLLYPHKRDIWGKLSQILRAVQLEFHLSKSEILELYLNRAPFGGTIEGIAAASYAYLQKSAEDLTYSEAALMAVLPQAPSRLRPDRHPARAQAARDKVLGRLQAQGIWSEQTVEEAQREFVAGYGMKQPMQAPLLARRLRQKQPTQRTIRTTIDGSLQASASNTLRNYVQRLPEQSSAAALIVDNATSEVRVYIGSADFFDDQRYGQVDMVRARRSPGSTLKPFLYGMALDAGLIHSESLLSDVPRRGKSYRPDNFERGFSGPVSVSYALQQSLNVPAVNLLENYGPQQFVVRLQNAGLQVALPAGAEANLSVILGGVGASLESLVSGYMAFSQQGFASNLRLALEDEVEKRALLSPGAAWIIRDILKQTPQPGRLVSSLAKKQQTIAWKTGTSYGYRDSWAIGTNHAYTIGVWIGRPDGTPMPGHWGGKTAAPLLFQLFQSFPKERSVRISQPESVAGETVCWPLGTALAQQPKEGCYRQKEAWVLNQQIPPTLLDKGSPFTTNPLIYWINPETGLRVNARCGEASRVKKNAVLWPALLEPWVVRSQRATQLLPKTDPSCPMRLASQQDHLEIVGVEQGSSLRSAKPGEFPSINLKANGASGAVHWYINGKDAYTTRAQQVIVHPFSRVGRFQIIAIDELGSADKLEITVLDNAL